jgi:uncharacterized protein (DUF1697 family)
MPRYVALFRGINVGKAKRIAMADLRAILARLGYTEVATLLNSGNAVFTGEAEPAIKRADRIRQAVLKQIGVDAQVIVKSARDMAGIIAGNELGAIADDHSRLLVALTNDSKALAEVKALAPETSGDERLHVGRHAAYLWCAHGILESQSLGALLKGLKGTGTTRNWATINKIHALMKAGEGPATGGR